LESFHPVILPGRVNREGAHVRNKAAHITIGVDTDGITHVPGIRVQTCRVCEILGRGVRNWPTEAFQDVLIMCRDGPNGIPEADRGHLAGIDRPDLPGAPDPIRDALPWHTSPARFSPQPPNRSISPLGESAARTAPGRVQGQQVGHGEPEHSSRIQGHLGTVRAISEVDWVLFPVFYWVTGVTCD
jgi:hypothetical protein